MVYRVKKLSYVAFQRIRGPFVISTYLAQIPRELPNATMRPLSFAAGIGVMDKTCVKKRIQDAEYCLMHHAVAHACFMYVSKLWVSYKKGYIQLRPVGMTPQRLADFKKMLLQCRIKLQYLRLAHLAALKFLPSAKNIFKRNYLLKQTLMTPPTSVSAPIIHTLCEVYKELYQLGKKVGKRERFGIFARIEDLAIECLVLATKAALAHEAQKVAPLKELRVTIDILKRLIRLCEELNIIEEKKYFSMQEKLIEASKMAHGWLLYVERKPRP